MTGKREADKRVEAYARALFEAGRRSEHANADLEQWLQAVSFTPEVVETLFTMRQHNDLSLLKPVADMYKELLDAEDKTVSVTVTTAVPLDEELREKISKKCEAELECPVYLIELVDPAILGGIVLEARGRRHDASVRAQLATIKSTLSQTFIGSDD